MSRVAQSAGNTAVQLFGTIATSANAFSTAVNAVGNAFDVLNVKSNDWLTDTKVKSAALAEDRNDAIIDEITFSIANRAIERDKILKQNPELKAAYDITHDRISKAVADARSKV